MNGLATGIAAISKPHPLRFLKLSFPGPPTSIIDDWGSLDIALCNSNLGQLKVVIMFVHSDVSALEEDRQIGHSLMEAALPQTKALGILSVCSKVDRRSLEVARAGGASRRA